MKPSDGKQKMQRKILDKTYRVWSIVLLSKIITTLDHLNSRGGMNEYWISRRTWPGCWINRNEADDEIRMFFCNFNGCRCVVSRGKISSWAHFSQQQKAPTSRQPLHHPEWNRILVQLGRYWKVAFVYKTFTNSSSNFKWNTCSINMVGKSTKFFIEKTILTSFKSFWVVLKKTLSNTLLWTRPKLSFCVASYLQFQSIYNSRTRDNVRIDYICPV